MLPDTPRKEPMRRVCFTLQVRPDRIDEYRARHAVVWPEMLDALRATGWTNYSLFLRPDGLLIGYVECMDFAASSDAMKLHPVNARWQAEMAPLFESLEGGPDDSMKPLDQVFFLA